MKAVSSQTSEFALVAEVETQESRHENHCVRAYGIGTAGVKCKSCRLLLRHRPGRKTYFKCELRKFTRGPGSDHRANWQSCSRYQIKEET